MTDFTSVYAQTKNATVSLLTDTGRGLAASSGWITKVNGQNYIITCAHSVLLDEAVWGMDSLLLSSEGNGCNFWKGSGALQIPAEATHIVFRWIPAAADGVGALDNLSFADSRGKKLFKDDFNSSDAFGSRWQSQDWSIQKYKGRFFSRAALSTPGVSSTLTLTLPAHDDNSVLKFDYKVDCEQGDLYVGYCSGGNCNKRTSSTISAYIGNQVHPLEVIGLDGKGDIAVCRMIGSNTILNALPALTITTDSRSLPIATPIATLGNPLGIDPQSISVGDVRDNRYTLPQPANVEALLTSNPDYAGNSGSPYLLPNGQVAGMLAWALSSSEEAATGFGGGPSANILNRVIPTLAASSAYTEYAKAYLGLDLLVVDLAIIDQLALPMTGVNPPVTPSGYVVIGVENDSPLRDVVSPLDILLTLNNQTLGYFPGQVGPSAVTWFLPPTAKVDLTLLRLQDDAWTLITLRNQQLRGFPVEKDIPLGPTMKKGVKGLVGTVKIHTEKQQKKYTLNKYI